MTRSVTVPVPESPDPLAQLQEGPIFIVGVARSGTTWVEEILAGHPLVASVWESGLFDSSSGLAELFHPRHWTGEYGVSMLMSRKELAAEVRAFASRILARRVWPGQRFLVEKTPAHLTQMRFISEVFPDSRFIHVLRDGRDVCVSTRAAARTWANDWKGVHFSLPAVARRWKRAVRQLAADREAFGDRLLEIRYEELKAQPEDSIRRIFDFCRIPYDESLVTRLREETDFSRRHVAAETAFFRGGRVGDWRTHFNMLDGLVFNAIAGAALVEAGYEPTRRWRPPLRRRVERVPSTAKGPVSASSGEREHRAQGG